MPYQSRIRNYKTRREKNQAASRTVKRILLFVTIGLAIWVFMNRVSLWDWFRTYFY